MKPEDKRLARREWAADFVVATAMGAFLGLLGPFGSFFNGPVWQRVGYWLTMAWLGYLLFGLFGRRILLVSRSNRAAWSALAAYALLMSAPLAVVSWVIARTIWPFIAHVPGLTPAVWYVESLIITVPQVALLGFLRRRRPTFSSLVESPQPAPNLLGTASDEVLCLQMEDHYVRVHTALGSRLVLATLAQSMDVLGRARGLRVHRSWWVADKAIAACVADGRRFRLVLTNGVQVPIARSSVAAVREAGWLRRHGDPEDKNAAIQAAGTQD